MAKYDREDSFEAEQLHRAASDGDIGEMYHLEPQDLLSNEFVVRWDTELASLLIAHPDAAKFPEALVQIRSQTLQGMSWQEASQFIGERLMLLMPELRERYLDPSTGMLRGVA